MNILTLNTLSHKDDIDPLSPAVCSSYHNGITLHCHSFLPSSLPGCCLTEVIISTVSMTTDYGFTASHLTTISFLLAQRWEKKSVKAGHQVHCAGLCTYLYGLPAGGEIPPPAGHTRYRTQTAQNY